MINGDIFEACSEHMLPLLCDYYLNDPTANILVLIQLFVDPTEQNWSGHFQSS